MQCIYTMRLFFSVSFIFINLHDIYGEHLKTQQDYDPLLRLRSKQSDGFTVKCPSLSLEVI